MNQLSRQKKSKTLAALLAAILMLTLLTACSGKKDPLSILDAQTAHSLVSNVQQEFVNSTKSILELNTNKSEETENFSPLVAQSLLSMAQINVAMIENDTITYHIVSPDMKDVMERAMKRLEKETGENYTVNRLNSTVYEMLNQKDYSTAEHTVSIVAAKEGGKYTIEPTVELADALLGGLIEYYKSITNEGGAKQ